MIAADKVRKEIHSRWHGRILWDHPLDRFTTLRVGGPAFGIAKPKNVDELLDLTRLLKEMGVQWRVIGRGSNLLVADGGYPGIVILLGDDFSRIEKCGETGDQIFVRAGAACGLGKLLNWCAEQGMSGLEFVSGIPGSVGGALAMNAGAWGRDMGQIIVEVEMLDCDGNLVNRRKEELSFRYRRLEIERGAILVAGIFCLPRGERQLIKQTCREILGQRKQRQPQRVLSAGSFFKNPEGYAAGRLIEEAGFKGYQIGGAKVSEKHANFIVNDGGASATDILHLMELIQKRVRDRTGILLEPEIHVLS